MFTPADRPRLAVSSDGALAAVVVLRTVTVVELATGTPIAERAEELSARAVETGWLDDLLLVVTRHDDRASLQLVDPWADRVVSELALDERVRLLATAGRHAVICGDRAAAVVSSAGSLARHDLAPGRLPVAAGAIGRDFAIASDEIVQWDPERRQVVRRLALAHPVTRIGGNPHGLWMTPQHDAARLEIVALDAAARRLAHELPEPIAWVASHASGAIACLGETGALYVIDGLDARPRAIHTGIDRVEAVAFTAGDRLLVARGAAPMAIVDLDGRGAPARGWRDDVVAWARAVAAGQLERRPPALPIDVVAHRLAVPRSLWSAVALLYGMHLAGARGAAPSDLARLVDGWDEALGRGALVRDGIACAIDSRIELAPAVLRALDELR